MSENKIPAELLNSLQGLTGFDEDRFIAAHDGSAPVTSVRLNPFKQAPLFSDAERIPWSSSGLYLSSRPSFTNDPLFHAGCYYVQEASSMFIEHLLKHTVDLGKPLRVLDLCAAPGGKSTLVNSLISSESLLVANEVIRTRVNILADNLTRWGSANVIVTNNDPSHFQRMENYFDVIIADAPCSGSGLFRKQEDAADEWSMENVSLCSKRQQRILADVMPALKPGGVLIYSTCSYSKEEDEEVCDRILDEFPLETIAVPVNGSWGIVETFSEKHKAKGFRFYPYNTKGEGFFAACFRKAEGDTSKEKKMPALKKVQSGTEKSVRGWLKQDSAYLLFEHNDEIHIFPRSLERDLSFIQSNLHIRKAGVVAGRITNGELIPDHELAMSVLLNDRAPCINVDRDTAIRYLKREDIKLPSAEKGWTLICFEDHALGWAKILPNRVNNYYPKELRILFSEKKMN